ncbi:hypothetical protein S14_184 [Shewanella sp. phage 1/4]|uniref:hypothetical protein n=1 Tax=Shewanella phage 1/4 TaxID=1458859 RepID=UPI0004F5BBED|nr:hypothetical protein S14_184 [Shewanella sp. phage 1/4]AHK11293.1 hypothetical protein S14_184 [Shewanella sp. phage 1/4]
MEIIMTQTKIVVVGNSSDDIIYSRLLEVAEGNPELLIIYVNEDNIDRTDGLDYDLLVSDELEDLGLFGGLPVGRHVNVGTIGHIDYGKQLRVQFDDCTGLEYRDYTPKVEVKHIKPFYHKGRW